MTDHPTASPPTRHAWRSAVLSPTSGLPAGARLVATVLAEYMIDSHTCWPSIATIAADTGFSERAVRDHLRTLDHTGWIHTTIGGGRTSSRYTATTPAESAPLDPETPAESAAQPGKSRPSPRRETTATPAESAPEAGKKQGKKQQQLRHEPDPDDPVVDELMTRRGRQAAAAGKGAGWLAGARRGIAAEVARARTRWPDATDDELADHLEPPAAPASAPPAIDEPDHTGCQACDGHGWIHLLDDPTDPDSTTTVQACDGPHPRGAVA